MCPYFWVCVFFLQLSVKHQRSHSLKSYRANNNLCYSSTPSTDGKKYTDFHSLSLAFPIVSAGTGSSHEAAQDKRGKIVEKINGWAIPFNTMKEEDRQTWLYAKIKSACEFLQKSLLNMLRLLCIRTKPQSWNITRRTMSSTMTVLVNLAW